MHLSHSRSLITLLIFSLILGSCSPRVLTTSPDTNKTGNDSRGSEDENLVLTRADIIWPEQEGDECTPALPAPSIIICMENNTEAAASAERAAVVMPAFLAQEALKQVLGSMSGGDWMPPYPLSLTGLPGIVGSAEGFIMVSTNPKLDGIPPGIIIAHSFPTSSNIKSVFFIIQNMPDPQTAEGLIITNMADGAQVITSAATIQLEIVSMSLPGSSPMDFTPLSADLTQDQYQVTGEIHDMMVLNPLEDIQQMAGGIVWGGIVTKTNDEYINSSPLIMGIDFGVPPDDNLPPPDDGKPPPDDNLPPPDDSSPPPDDSKAAIFWGGMPAGAVGIILMDSIPGAGSQAEGMIILHSAKASQVMGPIIIDQPSDDSSLGIEWGVPPDDNIPPPDDNSPPPDDGKAAIVWEGLVWGGSPAPNGSAHSIVLQNHPAGSIGSLLNNPGDLGLPEQMIPMMGDGGFGPMAFGTLPLQAEPYIVPAKEEKCFEILLTGLVPYLPGSGGESFPVDSFFDVFTELTVGMPEDSDGSVIVSRIDPPTYNLCTPTPGIATFIPELATSTPRIPADQPPPTPTIRTGLPTAAPTQIRRAPTSTPDPDKRN